jgi:hypothetical protein
VNKEGTAEGSASIGGVSFDNRHQTYEPVPIGYYVGPGGSGNAACTSDRCDSPNWIVDEAAWRAAGGTVAAKTLVRATKVQNSAATTGVSLGEVPFGEGTIRIAGALLPDPTEENHHPFGLFSYSLTYTGYQLFENLIDYTNPNRFEPGVDLVCSTCQITVRRNRTATEGLTVQNTGNRSDTFSLEAETAAAGLQASVAPGSVTVESGASAPATLTVAASKTAATGLYQVAVTATSQGASDVSDVVVVTVRVRK